MGPYIIKMIIYFLHRIDLHTYMIYLQTYQMSNLNFKLEIN